MPITARIWALTSAVRQNGFCAQKVQDSVKLALADKGVVKGMVERMEEGHRVNPSVDIVFTRAIESPSTTCSKNHFTSQVICRNGGKWLGGIHSFSNSRDQPTFKRPTKTVWKRRTLAMVQSKHHLTRLFPDVVVEEEEEP